MCDVGMDSDALAPILPPEVILRVGELLRLNEQLHNLALLLQTSKTIHDLLCPTLYTNLTLTDDQLGNFASVSGRFTPPTRSLSIITPLSSTTASTLTSLAHPIFPHLQTLTLTSAVLRGLPHDKPTMNSYGTSTSFKKKCKVLTTHLGPYRQLNIVPARNEECIFQILHPIFPTSLGISNFLPRLAALHPELEVMNYDSFQADLVYPTSRIKTVYKAVCDCWLKYGAERMGLGIRLAWAGESGEGQKGSTTVEIHTNGQRRTEWEGFEDLVLHYLRDDGEDPEGRVERRGERNRLKCLTVVHPT